jgi:hypothetical protein
LSWNEQIQKALIVQWRLSWPHLTMSNTRESRILFHSKGGIRFPFNILFASLRWAKKITGLYMNTRALTEVNFEFKINSTDPPMTANQTLKQKRGIIVLNWSTKLSFRRHCLVNRSPDTNVFLLLFLQCICFQMLY